jgi:anti-anti-sigma factor
MDIQVESHGEQCVVRIKDKITFEHCPILQGHLDKALEGGAREIIIDFREVPFMDSSGVGEILRLFKLLRDRNGELILTNANQKLHSLFMMYRFERFMKIVDSVEAEQK